MSGDDKKIELLQAQFIDHINSTNKEIKALTERIEVFKQQLEKKQDLFPLHNNKTNIPLMNIIENENNLLYENMRNRAILLEKEIKNVETILKLLFTPLHQRDHFPVLPIMIKRALEKLLEEGPNKKKEVLDELKKEGIGIGYIPEYSRKEQPDNDPYHIEKIFTKAVEKKEQPDWMEVRPLGPLYGKDPNGLVCSCGKDIEITVPMYTNKQGAYVCKECFKKLKDNPLNILTDIWFSAYDIYARSKSDAGEGKADWHTYYYERKRMDNEILRFWQLKRYLETKHFITIKTDMSKKALEIEITGVREMPTLDKKILNHLGLTECYICHHPTGYIICPNCNLKGLVKAQSDQNQKDLEEFIDCLEALDKHILLDTSRGDSIEMEAIKYTDIEKLIAHLKRRA